MTTMRRIRAIFAGVLLLAAVACGTSGPAPTPEATPTRAVEAAATPILVPPASTTAVPTPITPAPTPGAPSAAGIDVDPAKAEATLVQLVDALDEPEYYCVDVPGFGRSLNLEAALMAHTCKPGADDEMFAINRPGPGNLYMPAYDLCMEADRTGSPVQLYLRECSGSTLQQFELGSDGGARLGGHWPVHGRVARGRRADRRAEPPEARPRHAQLPRGGAGPEAVGLPGQFARMTNGSAL